MSFRVVQQSLWTDEKIMDCYSCEDKYFWLYLLTNPQTNQLGIYKLPIKLAAFQLGYSNEQVIVLLDRFENVLKQIKYNKETQEVAIAYFLNHSVISGGTPVMNCAKKDLNNVKDTKLIDFVIEKMKNKTITNDTVEKIIDLLKEKSNKKENILNENENDNGNDNDNGNGVSDAVSDAVSEKTLKKTNYSSVIDLYNNICISLPKVTKITERRKKAIKSMLNSFNESEIEQIFILAEESDFVSGRQNDWKASFDWLLNITNATKVIEGNYKNKDYNKMQNNKQYTKYEKPKEKSFEDMWKDA